MRLLDRIVRAVLAFSMLALAGYIILRSVAIAGENGLFRNTPLLSAVYEKIENWTAGTYLPVLSYAAKETQAKDVFSYAADEIFPLYHYAEQQESGTSVESVSEYEMIVRAQAQAEEHKQPQAKNSLQAESAKKDGSSGDGQAGEKTKEASAYPGGLDFETLLYRYFSMDMATSIDAERLDGEVLFGKDMTLRKNPQTPQILIYHTHSQEAFADSVEGDVSTTIVGIGEYLTKILREKYGYNVIHETGVFDLVDGVLDRNLAYDFSQAAVEKILAEYPSIEIVIDLHRDGVDGKRFVTEYNGKPAAQLMFIAGMSRMADGQDISYLPNPYIQDNLAFALQIQTRAEQEQPDLMRNIYLMAYRFNLHLRPRSLLLEAGTQLSTVAEEKNAMEAFAEILDEVLSGE